MDVRKQKSALRLLAAYPSPTRVRTTPDEARSLLKQASRGQLSAETVEGVVTDAHTTLGVPMMPEEELLLRTLANQALDKEKSAEELEHQMGKLAHDDEVFARLKPWMGTYTAAVMITLCDPRQYAKARQLEKACGLNLREKSSGEHAGRLVDHQARSRPRAEGALPLRAPHDPRVERRTRLVHEAPWVHGGVEATRRRCRDAQVGAGALPRRERQRLR